ncbi:MAG: type III-B CRISPR-associated protein Cas10/Cmr2 [Gammaproteobacteria bacterium]|nr:MAG: type III-B CRISPR-associated protein Cas10/Cmr2 [Gammaproteobacteria bacterium]
MTEQNDIFWQTKVAARLHDPAEKALVLLRDPAGHENGTSRALARLLGFHRLEGESVAPDNDEALAALTFKQGIPATLYRWVQRADWWAAAADRPQWPMDEVITPNGKTLAVAPWAQVHWTQKPEFIHPLSGYRLELAQLADTDFKDIKKRSREHFEWLLGQLGQDGAARDWRKTALALWRFGPELAISGADTEDFHKLGPLWQLLPADTRVPDHSIWDHLDLTSAFAGAFAADPDGQAALLALSIGPVQSFIASARKLDDLWAGSHLLARLSWEAMRVVCERLGPDAILFPSLRGIAQADLWLRDQMHLPDALFKGCAWTTRPSDENPLFAAALPNRFVAVVPASQAREIAEAVEVGVRGWLKDLGKRVVDELLEAAGLPAQPEQYPTPYEQMRRQLEGFPEVHWAAVSFGLIRPRDAARQTDLDVTALSESMRPFFEGEGEPGFLGTPAWEVLQKEVELVDENGRKSVFFAPNPGVLYPAVYELAERVLAAAKTVRPFPQIHEEGYRCTLTGEAEWLTLDRQQLLRSPPQQTDTLWAKIHRAKRSWAKEGEHLGGLAAIKRLWPTLFARDVAHALGNDEAHARVDRFVVSTHTMALAHQLLNLESPPEKLREAVKSAPRVALPRKVARELAGKNLLDSAARIPGWLDALRESEEKTPGAYEEACRSLKALFGQPVENYYALLLMDGDRMGAILSGDERTGTVINYEDSFHTQVQQGFRSHAQQNPLIAEYGKQPRAVSPNRHLAISAALNDFSQTVARHVVEEEFPGRLIYAGGDDVFAMLPTADVLATMRRLRFAYSGQDPQDEDWHWNSVRKAPKGRLICKNGFAWLDGRLMRMMGLNATASCGVVIAHHQAPLSAVRRELDAAEKRAKNEGGRDAFSITVIKRAGGALAFTDKWPVLPHLKETRDFLAAEGVSRRAVYHVLQWLDARSLPPGALDKQGMLGSMLAYQFDRQSKKADPGIRARAPELAKKLAAQAAEWARDKGHVEAVEKLRNLLGVAEFLARETRMGDEP